MRDTLRDWWTYACVAFTVGAAAQKRASRARARRRVRRRAGAY
jgi:hypothetical protein